VVLVTVFPRLDRLAVPPKPSVVVTGFALGRRELTHLLVFRMMPTVTLANLVNIDMVVANVDASAVATLTVDFDRVEPHFLVVDFLAEAVACRAPISLSVFGSVHAVQVDAMATSGFVEHCASISVLDGDDATSNRSPFRAAFVVTVVRA
jgi:hypothetical protein